MSKTQLLKDIRSIIHDSDSWIQFYYHGQKAGALNLECEDYTKQELFDNYYIEIDEDYEYKDSKKAKVFKLWIDLLVGGKAFYLFDCWSLEG